jgi:hypothetical protein
VRARSTQSSNYADKIKNLKHNVLQMLQERSNNFQQTDSQFPGSIWTEGLSLFDYVINLSEENFLNIRFHAGYISGSNVLQYWHQYPPVDPERYTDIVGYKFYTEDVPESYWIGEPPTPKLPRPLGMNYRGRIINQDICRYQSCISNLYSMGILELLSKGDKKNLILEIGAGYGGLAHQLGNILAQNCTCIILDLPEMLLFSGGYLIVNNPEKNIYIYEKSTFTTKFLTRELYKYDYVLLPNYVLKDLYALPEINLMINMQSFQEMTREQIDEYTEFGYTKLSGYLYSDNIDRHPFNNDLAPDTVTALLAKRFRLFPPPEFYRKIIGHSNPWLYTWLYKCYVGIGKDKDLLIPQGATIKLMNKFVKYSFINKGGRIKFKAQRAWLGHLITLGLKVSQLVLSRRRK